MSTTHDLRSQARLPLTTRMVVAVVGVAVMWITVVAAESRRPVDLTVVLLLMLLVVLGLALVTGPVLAVGSALIAVVLINWYLVPPYGTVEVSNPDNVVALVVFAIVAGVASALAELNARIRAGALRSRERAGLIAGVVAKGDSDGAMSLDRVRESLDLDRLSLVRDRGQGREVLATSGTGPELSSAPLALDVTVSGGYRLIGVGPARMAEDPGFVESLAAAAVRSYESDLMRGERRRAEELAAIDEARTALLASVGHDLRTPLSSLRLAVDALRDPGAPLDPETERALLETVHDATGRLDDLITNLLDMSRLEAGVLMAKVGPTSIDAAVAAALLVWPHPDVIAEVSDTLPLVVADAALLERVLENLVSNALRYAAPSPDHPVQLSAEVVGEIVVLDIADHGPGFNSRLNSDGLGPIRAGGGADRSTGLGLEIVRGFCAAMDVDVTFLETKGGGLTVRLSLPVAGAVS